MQNININIIFTLNILRYYTSTIEPCKGHQSELFFDFHTKIRHESLLGIRKITRWIALLFLLALCHQVGGIFLLAGSVGAFLETPKELYVGAMLPLEPNRATEKLFGCNINILSRIGAKWPPRKTKKKSLLRGSGSDMGYQT